MTELTLETNRSEPVAQPPSGGGLSRRQKAAVIVRLLLSEGEQVPLAALSEEEQLSLTEAMGGMRTINRSTLRTVVEEFVTELDSVGLAFPGGLEGALGVLEGHISAATASRLRRQSLVAGKGDPWARLSTLDPEVLLNALKNESVEVGAVILSKLTVARSAELLSQIPGEKARRIARAISETSQIAPDTVHRIGLALVQQIEAEPDRAFDTTPVERMGAILNYSPATTRDEVLEGLENEDADFAAEVRKALFTFMDIPARIDPRDVPKITKECDQVALVKALAAATALGEKGETVAEFLFAGMSQRMVAQLKDEISDIGAVKEADGEAAMSVVINAIREIETRGELVMIVTDE